MKKTRTPGKGIYRGERLELEPDDAAAREALDIPTGTDAQRTPAAGLVEVERPLEDTLRAAEVAACEALRAAGHHELVTAHDRAAQASPRSREAVMARWAPEIPETGLEGASLDAVGLLDAVRRVREILADPERPTGSLAAQIGGPGARARHLLEVGYRLGRLTERLGVRAYEPDAGRGQKNLETQRKRGAEGRRVQAEARAEKEAEWARLARELGGTSQRNRARIIAARTGAKPETVRTYLRNRKL